ncbi:nucleotidyltransferase family protein [Planctomycetota bacterium]|nr:nucleotidyltransferase family protein [Planctomycetota bacterium]
MTPRIKTAVVILAAGDSTRMGSPKALLDWHGQPLLRHVLDTAKRAGCSKFVVVLGRDAELIQANVDLSGVQVVVNQNPDDGQISSLKYGLQALDYSLDCVVCWPVDCPLIQAGDINALINSYIESRHARQRIFIPTHNGDRGHPMLIDTCLRPDFLTLPKTKNARDLINGLHKFTSEVPVDSAGVLVDIDTPEQYQNALNA